MSTQMQDAIKTVIINNKPYVVISEASVLGDNEHLAQLLHLQLGYAEYKTVRSGNDTYSSLVEIKK